MDDSLISHYEDMGSRETSPDPIVLPSSPPSGRKMRSVRKTRQSTPRKSRLSTVSRMTPSKEIVLDTPHLGPNDGSPWRIKVTVQAEQRDSPGKLVTRTTSIPLRSPSRSPTKKRKPTPKRKIVEAEEEEEEEAEQPVAAKKSRGRKRKAAPSAEKNSAQPVSQVKQSIEQPVVEEEQDDDAFDVFGEAAALEAEQAMQAMDSSSRAQTPPNNRRASGRLSRLSAQWSNGTGRTQRLSRAREELDEALQDAVGDVTYYGDLTLSRAEDFTMVSLESLQTAKEASMLHNSHLSRSHLSTVKEGLEPGEKSALSVSYLPSSPPKQAQAVQYPDLSAAKVRTSILSSWEPSMQRQSSLQSPFEPTSSARKRRKVSSPREESRADIRRVTELRASTSSRRTGNAKETPHEQWRREREAVSQQIREAPPQNVVTVDDDVGMSDEDDQQDFGPETQLDVEAGDEDAGDLWQTEASRDIEQNSHRDNVAEQRTHDSQRSERVEDLFAHIPPKPLRSKIPRTWRRSSGMDFSYIDSPAHLPLAEPTNERRNSTDGSGVLTPPSTDRSSEDIQEEVGTVDLQGEANDQLQSEFTQPETEGTRYQDDDTEIFEGEEEEDELQQNDVMPQDASDESSDADIERQETPRSNSNRDGEYAPSRNDSKSPLSDVESLDAADKVLARSAIHSSAKSTRQSRAPERGIMQGAFPSDVEYQPKRSRRSTSRAQDTFAQEYDNIAADNSHESNMPQQNNTKPRRRPPRRPTADLTELLGLASSPAKPAPQEIKISEVGKPAQHLRQSAFASTQKASPNAKHHPVKANGKAQHFEEVDFASPYRLKQTAVPAQNAFISPPKLTHDPITGQLLAQPKRRGRRKKAGDQSLTETSMTDSFASSNNSLQQQEAVVGNGAARSGGEQINGTSAPRARDLSNLSQQSEEPQSSSRDHAQQGILEQQRRDRETAALRKSALSRNATQLDPIEVLQSSAVKRKENHLMRQWGDEEEHAAKRRALREPSHERPGTGISTREYHVPARSSRRSGDQEQLLRESIMSRTNRITEQRHEQPQRKRFAVSYPDNEGHEQSSESEHANGHRRTISAADSNTDMPDDEGTRAPFEESLDQERSYEDQSTVHPEYQRSYEENLNLDSPAKIKVNFNDTLSFAEHVDQTSSWLAEARKRPALFDTSAPQQPKAQVLPQPNFRPIALERPPGTPEQKRAAPLPGLNIFSKLGSTLWNAVPRSKEPTEIYPENYKQAQQQNETSFATTITTHDDSTFTTSLRSQLRSRYGVLSSTHPWTMAHQRTLHRMLNSALSRRHDTLIPSSGPLPKQVFKLVDTTISSITGYKFHFTHQHAYVVWSFFQILVDDALVQDMKNGDVGFLGDKTAKKIRGYLDPLRHGDDLVWTLEREAPGTVVHYVEELAEKKQVIEWGFVARALGDCVGSNEILERRSAER